jgi:divalent metal cation (Fe/Co/Zn/Cd) transporter
MGTFAIKIDTRVCRLANIADECSEGTKVTWIGLASNVVLTAVKGVAGWSVTIWVASCLSRRQFNSTALLADAAHSLSDLASDIVTLYTLRVCAFGD